MCSDFLYYYSKSLVKIALFDLLFIEYFMYFSTFY